MKINPLNNISFQKKLIAKCNIGEIKNSSKAKIYELDSEIDTSYFDKVSTNANWRGNYYVDEINQEFEESFEYYPPERFYVMENENGDCVCIGVLKESDKENSLEYIETAPKTSSYQRNIPRIKYIGETMLAFLVKLTEQEKKKKFRVPDVAQRPKTIEFYYDHCGFSRTDVQTEAVIKKRKYDRFIKFNESHTGSAIEII